MQEKVGKVFIGKDISRTASVIVSPTGVATNTIAEGEIVVLDSNKNVMTAGSTYSDTKSIYLVEGLSGTYSYTNEAGTTITSVRKMLYSDAIDGAGVSVYSGIAYTAPAQAVWTVDLTGWVPVVGTEYRFRIIYKDLTNNDYPTQYTHSYQYIAGTATLATELTAIVALINADSRSRVVATEADSTDLILTGAVITDDDEILDIDDYRQVTLEVGLTSDNFNTYTSSALTTVPTKGAGYYKIVRDEECWSLGYEGPLNKTAFPVLAPTMRTVKSETYDTLVINHKNWITTAGNREEQVDITTKVFIPYTATSNQMTDILAVLNPWMASLGKSFSNVSF